jgi:hypothetical protein
MNHQDGGVYTYVIIPSGFNEGFVSITVTSSDGEGALSQISNANDQSHPAYLYASLFC